MLVCTITVLVSAPPLLQAESADAQSRGTLAEYSVRFWSEDHGLPSSFIRAIAQDSEGYIWIGSGTEVVRFDGVSFETSIAMGLDRRLPNGFVTALHAGADGTMWVGFSAGEIVAIRGKAVTIYNAADGLSGRSSSSLAEDGHGGVFAAGWGGLFWFDGERWRRQGNAQGVPEGVILVVYKDREDGIWAATPSALLHKASGRQTFLSVGDSDEASPSFAEDSEGRLWITDAVTGLRRVDGKAEEGPREAASDFGQVVQILFDRRGDLWIATMTTGLWRRKSGTNDVLQASSLIPATNEVGLERHPLRVMLEDNQGNLWVGTQHGLYRLTPHRVQSLATLGPVNVVENGPNGSVWVGTGSGLFRVSYHAGSWEILERRFAGMSVTALHVDRFQCLWASVGKAVVRLDGATVKSFPPPADIALSRINALSTDADATLWVGDMSAGLLRMTDGQWVAQAGFSEQNDGSVFALLNDDSGATWVGTGNRVVVMQRGGTTRTHARDDIGIGVITSLFQDD
ncbi:MAG: two-component regulator propeller domain-containing protein, partial [Vicinamibacterales bacterium]